MNRLKAQNKTHLQWVDHTKLLACALVVLGHFAQSMVRAGILPDTAAYTLCNSALYTFHVPLFFICSAYLYRRFTVPSFPHVGITPAMWERRHWLWACPTLPLPVRTMR